MRGRDMTLRRKRIGFLRRPVSLVLLVFLFLCLSLAARSLG